jgi:hypothetical protein
MPSQVVIRLVKFVNHSLCLKDHLQTEFKWLRILDLNVAPSKQRENQRIPYLIFKRTTSLAYLKFLFFPLNKGFKLIFGYNRCYYLLGSLKLIEKISKNDLS